MNTDNSQKVQRYEEMNRLIDLADAYYVEQGRFPTKIRVGANIARRLFPEGTNRARTAYFMAELDETLAPDEIVLDAV